MDAKETVRELIDAFVAAWPRQDATKVAAFFCDSAVYHNIPMEPVVGRPAIEATIAAMMAMGGQVSVEVAHILAEGPIVMVERVDRFVSPDRSITLPMVGVFEVAEGMIVAWRDYFDSAQAAASGGGRP